MAGGLERQIVRTCNELTNEGYRVTLFSYDSENAKSFYEIDQRVKWIKCGCNLKPHTSAPLVSRLRQIYFLRQKLLKESITCLVSFHHGIFPRSFLASIFTNIKLVVSERNALSNYKFIKLSKFNLGFLSLFLSHKITVQIDTYKNDYPALLRSRIITIPNLIKKPNKEYQKPNLSASIISMMGRLSEQKNFTPLLDQISSLTFKEDHNMKIFIAGEGDLRKSIERNYSDLIKDSILQLKGTIKDTDLFLSNSSIFCFPSLWEGYPNALVEAIRIGLPIVTTHRMAHLTSFVENKVNGLIVSDSELLNAIIYLLNNPLLMLEMSINSFSKYQKLYKESSINNWIKLFNSIQKR